MKATLNLLTALLLVSVAAAPAADPRKAVSGLIVFALKTWEGEYSTSDIPHGVAKSPTHNNLYLVNADGTGLRKVELGGQDAQNPHISADGQWIYYQTDKNPTGHIQIYRCRLDGSAKHCLTEGHRLGSCYGFELSADGRHVVFVAHDGKVGRVAVMDADGANARLLAPDIGYHYMASFSPDARQVVFSHTSEGYRLKVMDLEGRITANLAPDLPGSLCGSFTADGRTIVFSRRDGDIYRVDADGKNLKRLTHHNSRFTSMMLTRTDLHASSDPPHVSPDGTRIAFVVHHDLSQRQSLAVTSEENDLAQVHVMNVDGSGSRQITHLPNRCNRVRWSPDGNQVAFVSFVRESQPQLFVVSAEGGKPRQLTDLPGAVYVINWSPK